MPKKAFPIRFILIATFMLVGLLPIILMSVLAFTEAKSALTTEITHDMQTRVTATAGEVDRMMFERFQNVASWSALEVMQDARFDDVDKRLSHFLQELKTSYHDVYLDLYVVDLDGKVIASSNAQKIGQNYLALIPTMQIGLPNREITLSGLQGVSSKPQRLGIEADILDRLEAKPLAKLIVEFNWRHIESILGDAVSGKSAAAMFDKNGMLIAQTDAWAMQKDTRLIKTQAMTNDYLGLGWRLEIAQKRSEVMAPVHRMGTIFIALLIISMMLAMLIGVPLVRYITNPLLRLTQFANQLIRAPNTPLPAVGGPEEIRDLSNAFAKMMADLELSKEALTRAAKLAVAGEMAAAMSHEVRTPLGILRSSAQILLREKNLSMEAIEVCGFMLSETERLNKLVNTLIDAGRPRAPEYAEVNLVDLAEHAANLLRMQADKKSVSIQITPSESLNVACDAEQMTQVLLNLMLNAIQVLPEGGMVNISVSQQAEFAMIEVADNGAGITPEIQSQIFEPFFTQREGGIGLGLAVVRQIVEAHQGKISLSNGSKESAMPGAHFRVMLPLLGVKSS